MKTNMCLLFCLVVTSRLFGQDLSVRIYTSAQVVGGNSYYVRAEIRNTGTRTAFNHEVAFYASLNNSLGPKDVLLYKKTISSTLPGSTTIEEGNVTIPADLTPGVYHLIVKADNSNKVAETNEKNNIAIKTVQIVAPWVDLYFSDVSASVKRFVPGTTFTFRAHEVNTGNTIAAAHTIGYYLSSDSIYDSKDVLLSQTEAGPVGPGNEIHHNQLLAIPEETPIGNYYLIARTDTDNRIKETSEKNNKRTLKIKVEAPLADLAIKKFSVYNASPKIPAGGSFSVYSLFENLGNVSVTDAELRIIFSPDSVISFADNLLLLGSIGFTFPSDTLSKSFELTMPANTTAGTYYILCQIAQETPADGNKANNIKYVKVEVEGPLTDIIVSGFNLRGKMFKPGSYMYPEVTLNTSGNNVRTTSLAFFLSADDKADSTDILLKTTSSVVYPGQAEKFSEAVWIDSGLTHGAYHVLVVADMENLIPETDETNNSAAAAISLTEGSVDLTIAFADTSTVIARMHTAIELPATISNLGTVFSGATTVSFFLSGDSVYDSTDQLLFQEPISGLGGDTVELRSVNFFTYDLLPGTYYILALINAPATEAEETNVNNNAAYRKVTLMPLDIDYSVLATLDTPLPLTAGSTAYVNVTETNTGEDSGGGHSIVFYLSEDQVISETERVAESLTYVPGKSSTQTYQPVVIPESALGNYYLIVKADGDNQSMETDETNNLFIIPVSVKKGLGNHRNSIESNTLNLPVLSVYPNPTNGLISFQNIADADEFEVADGTGAIRLQVRATELLNQQLDLSSLTTGIYTLKLKKEGRVVSVHKVMLNK